VDSERVNWFQNWFHFSCSEMSEADAQDSHPAGEFIGFATVYAPSCSSVGKGMATAVEYPDGGFPMDCLPPGETWRLSTAKAASGAALRQAASSCRAAASAVSSGRVLKAIVAFGAALWMMFTTVSNSTRPLGGSRIPPPITTQS
jgi:hypothetical protein